MQIHRIGFKVKGFYRLADYAVRWSYMISATAKHRARVLQFWATHGLAATVEAFQVKRRTLYLWKLKLREGNGALEALNPQSRRPTTVRKRSWPFPVIQEIKRLRQEHPNLGPDKVAILLQGFCIQQRLRCPAARTVARIVENAPDKMRMFPVKVTHFGRIKPRTRAVKTRKPKHFIATHAGHCGAFDTVERFVHGCRRYVLTFTDVYSRFAFAWATTSHASKAAEEFFRVILQVFPYRLEYVLTDNGSEFMKHFDAAIRTLAKDHWHTYPKMPKMNAHDERFNRTIQEEFVDYHEPELLDPSAFNAKLIPYLLWFNSERPHWGLKLKSPIQFLMEKEPEVCNMWWRDTLS